ncbi:MAG TPA: hypothetical protein VF326_13375 [Anaerolineaceae bacterium]
MVDPSDPDNMRGTFGVDEKGELRGERQAKLPPVKLSAGVSAPIEPWWGSRTVTR